MPEMKRQQQQQQILFLFSYIDRIPKKNHQSLIQLNSKVIDTFKKYGVLKFEVFQLGSTNDMMGFTNIDKTISAATAESQEEEVWLEIQTYQDHNHFEEVGAKMMADDAIKEEGQQFFNLITPGSRCSFGEFNRIKDVGFS